MKLASGSTIANYFIEAWKSKDLLSFNMIAKITTTLLKTF